MKNRTWQDNAAEFAALDEGEGWQFAVLVACSVEKGAGTGSNQHSGPDSRRDLKVSGVRFAEEAGGTSDKRVLRYLAAWQKAADKGWVPDASTLTPADAHTVTIPDEPWDGEEGVYTVGDPGGHFGVERIAARAAKDPAYAKKLVDGLVVGNPVAAEAAQQALDKRRDELKISERRAHVRDQHEADSKKRHSLRFMFVDGSLSDAAKHLRKAIKEMEGVPFDTEERNLLGEDLNDLTLLIDAAKAIVAGDAADWDAALANINGGI